MTSTRVRSMYWRATSLWSARCGTCAAKAAGVASVIWQVLTSPTDRPEALASSRMVVRSCPLRSIETEPLSVFTPVAMAVAAAAESVTNDVASADVVPICPR